VGPRAGLNTEARGKKSFASAGNRAGRPVCNQTLHRLIYPAPGKKYRAANFKSCSSVIQIQVNIQLDSCPNMGGAASWNAGSEMLHLYINPARLFTTIMSQMLTRSPVECSVAVGMTDSSHRYN
jgi:hypothetical protein